MYYELLISISFEDMGPQKWSKTAKNRCFNPFLEDYYDTTKQLKKNLVTYLNSAKIEVSLWRE